MQRHPDKPHRLARIFQSYDPPVYFITFNTFKRRKILANERIHVRFKAFAAQAEKQGAAVGRYVIMPDHMHCFIRIAPDKRIGTTIRLLKRSLSSVLEAPPPHWQPGFFDHVLRHSKSYRDKWNYVVQNPVRAGLAEQANDWPYQGEVVPIRY